MSTEQFGKIRSFLWPVYRSELKKFVPMLLIFFLICFNYNILRATKDALVVTAPHSGAEAIPFLKVWAILPMAFLMTFIFTRLSNKFGREKIFYILMSLFIGFFAFFAFVLYPLRDSLHPHAFADHLQEILPIGCRGLIAIIRNWTFTLFYVMAEMWSPIIMTVLFWGFANDVMKVKQAVRLYGLFGIGANLSGILSGHVATLTSSYSFNPNLPFGNDAWGQSLIGLTIIVIICAIACIGLYRWMHKKGLGYNSASAQEQLSSKPKIKLGMRKSFKYLSKSKYLICIAVIVLMYNISINLIEVVWKDQLKELYPNPRDFNAYMGRVQMATGVIATIIALFLSSNMLRRFSWRRNAMIVPIVLVITSTGFFAFMLLKNHGLGSLAMLLSSTPLAMCVFFGSMQNSMSRALKYTIFDATKELAFVPLDLESKMKGKAAIDGVGSRLGKSGGSLIHQILLMIFGTVFLSTPYVAFILLAAVAAWMLAVRSLGKQFKELSADEEDAEETSTDSPVLA